MIKAGKFDKRAPAAAQTDERVADEKFAKAALRNAGTKFEFEVCRLAQKSYKCSLHN